MRVSTTEQAGEGVSLDAQRARISAWCAANGFDLVALHADEGLSGKSAANRPALRAALTDACTGKAALVVYSLSRLARSTKDALSISERLAKAGPDLVLPRPAPVLIPRCVRSRRASASSHPAGGPCPAGGHRHRSRSPCRRW